MSTRYTTTVCEHYHRRPDGAFKCASDAHKFGKDVEIWVITTNTTDEYDEDGKPNFLPTHTAKKIAVDVRCMHKMTGGQQ